MYVETLLIKHYYMTTTTTTTWWWWCRWWWWWWCRWCRWCQWWWWWWCPALRELTCDSCGSVSSQVVHVEDGVFSWDKADKPTLSKYVLDSFHP